MTPGEPRGGEKRHREPDQGDCRGGKSHVGGLEFDRIGRDEESLRHLDETEMLLKQGESDPGHESGGETAVTWDNLGETVFLTLDDEGGAA